MKGISAVAILLCISLVTTTALARPFLDSTKQHHVVSSVVQVKPDFSWLQAPPRLPGPWWWFIPPQRPGLAPAPHGKLPGAQPPIPHHFHNHEEPADHYSSVVAAAEQEKDSASSSGELVHSGSSFGTLGGRMLPWWWLIQPHAAKPPGHNDIEAATAAAIEKCWSPLAAEGNCVYDILSAFTTGTVEFDSPCCSAINKMGKECFASFNDQEFADTLGNYCSTH